MHVTDANAFICLAALDDADGYDSADWGEMITQLLLLDVVWEVTHEHGGLCVVVFLFTWRYSYCQLIKHLAILFQGLLRCLLILKPDIGVHRIRPLDKLLQNEIGLPAHLIDLNRHGPEPHVLHFSILLEMFFQVVMLRWYVHVADKDCSLGSGLLDDGFGFFGIGISFDSLRLWLFRRKDFRGLDLFGDDAE